MKFTFWAVGLPFLAIGVLFLMNGVHSVSPAHPGMAGLFALWCGCGAPATVIYWIVRLVRRAWGDGDRQATARPAGWIYPNER